MQILAVSVKHRKLVVVDKSHRDCMTYDAVTFKVHAHTHI